MIFEKLQLDNAAIFIDDLIVKLENGEGKDRRRLSIVLAQKKLLQEWSEWITTHYYNLPLKPVKETGLLEPSAALKHFWIGFFFEKEHVPFNIVTSYFLTDFNPEAFRNACDTIIGRHAIFRTIAVFLEETRSVKQKILPEVQVTNMLNIIDVSNRADREKESIVAEHLEAARDHIFDHFEVPAYYFTLLKCEEDKYFVIFNISHTVFDSFSRNIFETEFRNLYSAYCQNKGPALQELSVQYKDFCAWEGRFQQEDLCSLFKTYWSSQSKSRYPRHNISAYYSNAPLTDYSYRQSLKSRIRPYLRNTDETTINAFYGIVAKAERTYARSYRFTLYGDGFSLLDSLCKERVISAQAVIITALNILVYRKTSSDDVVIGANIAMRDRVELQKMIGFLVNTILIRNKVDDNKGFDDLLTDVIINTSLASFFKFYTMSRILDDIDIPFNCINSVFLNIFPAKPGKTLDDFSQIHYKTKVLGYFDIDLHAKQYINGIEFVCNYNNSIYSEQDISLLFDEFIALLAICLTDRATPIAYISRT